MTAQSFIKNLFDYQLFEKNERLEGVISDTVFAYENNRELSESELDVWAAGDHDAMRHNTLEDKNE